MLGLRFCARAFSSCSGRGPLFIAVRRPLTIAASLVAEHRLQTHRLSNCGSRAQLLCGMWDLPRPGLEPVSPVLAGGFSTTAPPGKPTNLIFVFQLRFNKVQYAKNVAFSLSSSILKWLHKISPILISFLKMNAEMAVVTIQSNKIVSNEVKDN